MTYKIDVQNEKLFIFLEGEIDHHNSRAIREDVDLRILESTPKEIYLDFKNVSFMDSSGIGLIMGRVRTAESYGGRVFVANTSNYLKRVMRIAGLLGVVSFCDTEEEKI